MAEPARLSRREAAQIADEYYRSTGTPKASPEEALQAYLADFPEETAEIDLDTPDSPGRGMLGHAWEGLQNQLTAGVTGDHPDPDASLADLGGYVAGSVVGALPWFAVPYAGAARLAAQAPKAKALATALGGAVQGLGHGYFDAPRQAASLGLATPTESQRVANALVEGTAGAVLNYVPPARGALRGAIYGAGTGAGASAGSRLALGDDHPLDDWGTQAGLGGILGGTFGWTASGGPGQAVAGAQRVYNRLRGRVPEAPPEAPIVGSSLNAPQGPPSEAPDVTDLANVPRLSGEQARRAAIANQIDHLLQGVDLEPNPIRAARYGGRPVAIEGRQKTGDKLLVFSDPESQRLGTVPRSELYRYPMLYEVAPGQEYLLDRPQRHVLTRPIDEGAGRHTIAVNTLGQVEMTDPQTRRVITVAPEDAPAYRAWLKTMEERDAQREAGRGRPKDIRPASIQLDDVDAIYRRLSRSLAAQARPEEQAVQTALQPRQEPPVDNPWAEFLSALDAQEARRMPTQQPSLWPDLEVTPALSGLQDDAEGLFYGDTRSRAFRRLPFRGKGLSQTR